MSEQERKDWEDEKIGHDLHHATANIVQGAVAIVIILCVAANCGIGPWAH